MNLQVDRESWWLQQAAFKHEKYVHTNKHTESNFKQALNTEK